MATITTGVSQVYEGTSATSMKVVGYNNKKNCVARYSFKTDAVGASKVSWEIGGNSLGGGTRPALRWYITTSASSHINAGASTTAYHGTVTVKNVQGYDVFSGSADVTLLPNTTYYLWIFPNTTTYGFYYLGEPDKATVTTSGGAGLVYIDNGGKFEAYQCYIDNGTKFELYMPYIDNGSSFDLMT